jgi:hypothetical protein
MDLPEVHDYADRCFRSCDGERERRAMQRKLHAIISSALTDGRVRTIDWASYPTPLLDRREIAREGLKDACMGLLFADEDPVEMARRALDSGASIDNTLDGDSLSPLAAAVRGRHIAVANYLLDRGAKATSEALIRACVMTSVECPLELVERLLKAGADVGEGGSPYVGGDKLTPLYYAVDQLGTGNVPLARLLLDYGAPIDVGNVDASAAGLIGGQTPLYKACQYGEVAMTRLLLARGAGWDKKAYSDPKSAKWATPLLAVRLGMASPAQDQINALFDDFLAHYWALRVALRLFGRRENHASGPQRVVLGDAYLPTKIGAFVVGDGILVKKKK